MSLYGAFDKTRHFAELADNATDQHGNLLTPTVRRNTALQNLTGSSTLTAAQLALLAGLTSTAAELNLLDGTVTAAELALIDGATVANAVASKAAILDTGGDLVTASNVGTSAATSVKEYGDGFHHVTVLTATSLALPQPTGGTLSARGDLIYTFPAGAIILESAYMNVTVTIGSATQTDEADIGLGTVIATGAVSVLGGTATFEDIITGQDLADVDGTDPVPIAAMPSVGAPLFIASGDVHAVHFNVASDWADAEVAAQDLEYSGTVVLIWKFLE